MQVINKNLSILYLEKKDLKGLRVDDSILSLGDFNLPKSDLTKFDLIVFSSISSNEFQILYTGGNLINV